MLSSQTENPYWNKGVQGTPACDAIGVIVERSTRINLVGVVWCSWFCSKSYHVQSLSPNQNMKCRQKNACFASKIKSIVCYICSYLLGLPDGMAHVNHNTDTNIFGGWSVGGVPIVGDKHNVSDRFFTAVIGSV